MSSAAASSWHTAAELAAMGLPGLPDEPRRLREMAKVEGWAERTAEDGTPLVRERRARGGGIEFNAGVLPLEAQLRLRARTRTAAPAPIADTGQDNGHADAWARFEASPASVQSAAHKRIKILSEIEDMAALGTAKTTAVNTVAKLHGVSARAIADWYKLVRDVWAGYWRKSPSREVTPECGRHHMPCRPARLFRHRCGRADRRQLVRHGFARRSGSAGSGGLAHRRPHGFWS